MKWLQQFKQIFYVLSIVALVAGVFVGGVFFGYSQRPEIEKVSGIFKKETLKPMEVDFSPFWKTWNVIESKFVESDKLEGQKRVWGAIEGMVQSLDDPYSVFFPPQESKMFEEDIQGNFGGVGMEIGIRKDTLTVIAPLKDTPAERAGVRAGDKIMKIDETLSADMMSNDAAQLIRGVKGTTVKLTIIREGEDEPVEIEIARDTIEIPALDTEVKEGGIFVIRVYSFSASSINEFRTALREFITSGNKKLILDLRNNPGGYLQAAIDMSSWFLPVGKIVTREKFGDGTETLYRSAGYDIFQNLPMVILVNEGSASASEILAGALQEHDIAKLVGKKTFGKGSVQELVKITPDTSLKITIAKWLTPSGKSISKEGLDPDIEVEFTKEDFEGGRDPQMEKAVDILLNRQ